MENQDWAVLEIRRTSEMPTFVMVLDFLRKCCGCRPIAAYELST